MEPKTGIGPTHAANQDGITPYSKDNTCAEDPPPMVATSTRPRSIGSDAKCIEVTPPVFDPRTIPVYVENRIRHGQRGHHPDGDSILCACGRLPFAHCDCLPQSAYEK